MPDHDPLCARAPICRPQVAYWLETAKMRSQLTGNLLGGLLLADLLRYVEA